MEIKTPFAELVRDAHTVGDQPGELCCCYFHVHPTTYCRLNPHVPILQLFFDGASNLRPDLRLSRHSIAALTTALTNEADHGWEKELHVLVFLYWLAHAASYRVVSRAFDIPKTTVHRMVHQVSGAVGGLLKRIVRFPPADQMEEVGAGFARLAGSPAFSVAVGAIDGCHIRIKPPAEDASCYYNRKLFASIQLQAICDHRGKFIDICCGFPGSVHDARVLKNSPVYSQQLYPPEGRCILGDGGYPCLTAPIRLMTPYRAPVLNAVQARYNHKLSRARCIIERAFGMMKTRWRSIFFKSLEVSHTFAPVVVTCCTILHNLCLENGDIMEPDEEAAEAGDNSPEPGNREVETVLPSSCQPPDVFGLPLFTCSPLLLPPHLSVISPLALCPCSAFSCLS
ncbi:putative nuclease HARBI1 [Centroberyx affinis]|uniref:putative nuclease HARBI1 n=1 Tax=Centroberyx affinis TaxID=166261 RepID=UPI003A5C054A